MGLMNFALTDEQQLIVSTIRRFVDKEIATWAGDADRSGATPDKLLATAGDVGFLIDAVPADADGLLDEDYSHLTRALRSLELGRGCSAMAALLECNVEPALAATAWGSDRVKQELFASLTSGGSATTAYDARGVLTIVRDGDGATLSGRLGPVPALADASHLLLVARCEDKPFVALVPVNTLATETVTPSGWRCARWASMSADGVSIPGTHVLNGEDAADTILAWYRTSLAARAIGVAIAAMKHAEGYASERIQFGQPIGSFESLIRMRDRNETSAAAGRLLVLEAAWQLDDANANAHETASRARDFAADVVSRATIDGVQIFGGYGFVNDYPVEKLMRDARAYDVLVGNEGLERVLARRFNPAA